MVHKKHIKRNGKTYGPYYYESYREGGKVRKRYLTSEEAAMENPPKKNRRVIVVLFLLLAVFALLIGSILISNWQLSGRAVMNIETSYNPGENIAGSLNLVLKQGELLPAGTLVEATLGVQSASFALSELTDAQSASGDYYAEDANLQGSGEGYGLAGRKKAYPRVDFQIKIITPARVSENPEEGEIPASEFVLSGTASGENSFSYGLEEGQTAELVSGSVSAEGQAIPDNSVNVEVSGNSALVSVDYFTEAEGFGADYLGSETMTLSLDLGNFAMAAENGTLTLRVYTGDAVLASGQADIVVGAEPSDTTNSSEQTEDDDESGGGGGGGGTEVQGQVSLSLIKEIPKISIEKGKTASINLSKYFSGAASYTFSGNISVRFQGSVMIIEPAADFTGRLNGNKVTAHAGSATLQSNEFSIRVSMKEVAVNTSRERIVIGQPVRWKKDVVLASPASVSVVLPAEAENIIVTKTEGGVQQQVKVKIVPMVGDVISGNVVAEINLDREPKFISWLKNLFRGITGHAVDDGSVQQVVEIGANSTRYSIAYSTAAPAVLESVEKYGKKVVVSGPNLGYTDIVTFASIDDYSVPVGGEGNIKVYWVEEGAYVAFTAQDKNSNGFMDYVEWVTPHLSEQNFMIMYAIAEKKVEAPVEAQWAALSPPASEPDASATGNVSAESGQVAEGKFSLRQACLLVILVAVIFEIILLVLNKNKKKRGSAPVIVGKEKKVKGKTQRKSAQKDIADKIEVAVQRSKGNEWKYWREKGVKRGKK
jgi:hypothetical protein